MALDDFDIHDGPEQQATPAAAAAPTAAPVSAQAKKPASSEDEDLFDFPIVEMKFESDASKRPAVTGVPAAVAAAAATPAPAAPAPATPAATAPAVAPVTASAPSKKAAAPTAHKDVAQAAQLVDDIEEVLGSESKPRKHARREGGRPTPTLVGIALVVLTNILGVLFLWRSSESFHEGVQAMSQQIAESMRRQALMQPPPEPEPAHTNQDGKSPALHAPVPLEAFEKVALQLAREEIQAGEYAAARRRLARLLAVADRIEAESREDIEAEASFLLANTYRQQAEAAQEKEKTP
ncbi:MAG: hypothetical protein IPJ19_05590 [Planctomycetes bacterium]|nr:hypothetical protein [Planctomycetota bacterium]